MVPGAGLEPARPYDQGILSPLMLVFPKVSSCCLMLLYLTFFRAKYLN